MYGTPLSLRAFLFQSNKEVKIKESLADESLDFDFGVKQNHLDPCLQNPNA